MSSGGKRCSAVPSGLASGLAAAARGLLLALPVVLPFETPLFSLGPLVITTAELVLYALLGLWLAAAALDRDRLRLDGPVPRAVALWLAVVVVAALGAPAYRGPALKFALRTVSGGLLFFAAQDLLRQPGLWGRLALSVAVGASLSAVTAILESALPGATWLWRPFRTGATGYKALGLPRASGSFTYPTIAAMYWEAALAVVVALPVSGGRLGRARPSVGGALVTSLAALLVTGILVSATRTALLGAAVAGAALLAVSWRQAARLRLAAGGALAVTLGLVALTLLPGESDSLLAQRLHWWRDEAWFRARYAVAPEPLRLPAGQRATVPVTVQNTGVLVWPHRGTNPVHLSYHWETLDGDGPRLGFEGRRTVLPADLPPHATVSLVGAVRAPSRPGRYRLRWDMVCEGVTWFSERGTRPADQLVEVIPTAAELSSAVEDDMIASSLEDWITPAEPSRPDLWVAALKLWSWYPLLGVGPDNFRRRYPEVITPAREGRHYDDQRVHANNLYLETLADLGLAGMAALALLLAAVLGRARAHAAAGRLLPLVAAIGFGTFYLHGLLDYFLAFTPTIGLHWLLLACADPRPASPDSTPSAPPR